MCKCKINYYFKNSKNELMRTTIVMTCNIHRYK